MERGGERESSVQIGANDPAKKKRKKERNASIQQRFQDNNKEKQVRIMLAHNHTL